MQVCIKLICYSFNIVNESSLIIDNVYIGSLVKNNIITKMVIRSCVVSFYLISCKAFIGLLKVLFIAFFWLLFFLVILLELFNTSLNFRHHIGNLLFYSLLDFVIWFEPKWANQLCYIPAFVKVVTFSI